MQIDVKPLSCPSSINPSNRGKIPVAIITTPCFDAIKVDPTTVRFADAAPVKWAWEDFYGDGDVDLVLKFKTWECNLPPTSGHVPLLEKLLAASPFPALIGSISYQNENIEKKF